MVEVQKEEEAFPFISLVADCGGILGIHKHTPFATLSINSPVSLPSLVVIIDTCKASIIVPLSPGTLGNILVRYDGKSIKYINAYISRKFAAIIRERKSNQSDGI